MINVWPLGAEKVRQRRFDGRSLSHGAAHFDKVRLLVVHVMHGKSDTFLTVISTLEIERASAVFWLPILSNHHLLPYAPATFSLNVYS